MSEFLLDLENCDGENDQAIVDNASCEIPISALKAAPFNLVDGDAVNAVVVAFNSIGDSD